MSGIILDQIKIVEIKTGIDSDLKLMTVNFNQKGLRLEHKMEDRSRKNE